MDPMTDRGAAGAGPTPRYVNPGYEPGVGVRHPARPDWGAGVVQSAIGPRITVMFENAGKVLVNAEQVTLDLVDPPR
jgi:Protein of unknown function (DUF3553)